MMRKTIEAALLCAMVLAPCGAMADTTYVVDKVTITGSRTVPTEKLLGAIQEHKGSRVTQADIVADQNAITKMLGDANVVGGIKTSMASKPNKHIDVVFAVDDQGAQAPVVTKVAPKLHAETFDGNKSIETDKLTAAAGLNPGDDLTNAKIVDAQKAIIAVYSAAKLPLDIKVQPTIVTASPGKVDITWHVTEAKGTKKPKDERSRDAQDQVQ